MRFELCVFALGPFDIVNKVDQISLSLSLLQYLSDKLSGKTADSQVMSKPSNILFGSPQMLKWFPVTTVVLQPWSSSTTVKTSVNTKQPVIA